MKMSLAVIAAALFLAAQPLAGQAQSIEEKQIASGKFSFDSASGYIFLHGPLRQSGMFLKVPDQADVDAYKKDWDEAFAKARNKYAKQLASWEADRKGGNGIPGASPPKPIEPKAETFTIGDIETRTTMSFGPQNVFSKDPENNYYSYFMKVKPGTYVYYGAILFDVNAGYMGTCYCMGSVKFDVKPGTITDVGNFLTVAAYRAVQTPATGVTVTPEGTFVTVGKQKFQVSRQESGLPASLKAYPSVEADFHAAGKMDNFFGISIGRIPAMSGIIDYQRDKVVDLKAAASSVANAAQP